MTPSDSIEVAGVTIDADHLGDVIRAASQNGVPAFEFRGDGPTWIHHVVRAIGNQEPLLTALCNVVDQSLAGDALRASFVASNILDERPELVGRERLLSTMQRSDLGAGAEAALVAALVTNLEAGSLAYGADLRTFDDDRRYDDMLAIVFLFRDHAWYIGRLVGLAFVEARRRIERAALRLTNRELVELRSELEARQAVDLVRWLDQEAASELAAGRNEPQTVRWRP